MKFLLCISFISYLDKYLNFRCARDYSCPNQTFSIKDIWKNIFRLIGTELILPSLHILGKDQITSYSAANLLMHTSSAHPAICKQGTPLLFICPDSYLYPYFPVQLWPLTQSTALVHKFHSQLNGNSVL